VTPRGAVGEAPVGVPALEADLPRNRISIGFVHGSWSPMPLAASTDAAERIPGAWVEVVEGAGHFLWVEARRRSYASPSVVTGSLARQRPDREQPVRFERSSGKS
jgi:pimeloyl-ACP methyl ester carboxylesterase